MNKSTIRFDYNNMMDEFIGKEQGISKTEINNLKGQVEKAYATVKEGRGKGMMGWTELAYNQDEIVADIIKTASTVRKEFKNFVVLGIGGSALGPIAVFQALCHLHYNELSDAKRNGPKFYVEDNVDPERMKALFDIIDVKETMFNVITKSGATSETMTQYLVINDILKSKLGKDASKHIIATTDEKKGNLIKIAKADNLKTYYIPDGVGGRFSEICPVGLLPAAVLGIDIKALLEGVAHMDKQCGSADMTKNMALMAATLQYISMKKGKNISVMMPYADSLKYIADWYCQLWGESLGKATDKNGNKIFAGQTPVKSLGVTDQHSQIQLYTEGPFDKVITFIGVDNYRTTVKIAQGCDGMPDVNFLCGHTMNELIDSERRATEYALTSLKRANNTIMLNEVNAHTLGQLLMFFMLETAYAGALLNIDAFNQPGVEAGKIATFALLGRQGYEAKKQELDSGLKKKNEYII